MTALLPLAVPLSRPAPQPCIESPCQHYSNPGGRVET